MKKNGINAFAENLESSTGKFTTALVFGFILLLLAILYGAPTWEPTFHGVTFSRMANSPWVISPDNWVQYRILSPVLGYLFFLRGNNFVWLMLLMSILFLALVYLLGRKNNLNPIESLGVAALMAFSTPLLFSIHFPGYTDLTTYCFIVLIMMNQHKKTINYILFGIALFNHEILLFLIPWIVLLLSGNKFLTNKYFQSLGFLLIASLPYFAFRFYIANLVDVHYSTSFYFSSANIFWTLEHIWKLFPLGVFEAFKLFWLLPVLALFNYKKLQENYFLIAFVLIMTGTFLQLLIASDTSRLIGLAFPAILLGAFTMKEKWGEKFSARIWLMIGINLLIPSCYVGQETIIPYSPYFLKLFSFLF
jgi:hypothetical protein